MISMHQSASTERSLDNYREIKLLALFLNDFGEDMASLRSEIPATEVLPGDMHAIRTACRHDADHGYVFFNNYQRRWKMDDHPQVTLEGLLDGKENVTFPAFDLKSVWIFPYNMKLNDAVLHTALATPLCVLHTKEEIRSYLRRSRPADSVGGAMRVQNFV